MSQQPNHSNNHDHTPCNAHDAVEGYLPHGGARPATVLCLEADTRSRKRLEQAATGLRMRIDSASTIIEIREALQRDEYDVLMLCLDRDQADALDLARELSDAQPSLSILLSARKPTLDQGIQAMRCGAIDLIAKPYDVQEVRERITTAADRSQRLRQQLRRIERLKRICRRLNQQRQEVNTKVDVLCGDLMNAYQQLADTIEPAAPHQLSSMIEAELDVETLLRRTLEYMLTKTGPTNAAVFLPGNSGDFSLGAYVNYNLPKDTADTLLDHMADVIPHHFEHDQSLTALTTDDALDEHFGDHAAWLLGNSMLAATCHSPDGDCLAVITIFREQSDPFTDPVRQEVLSMRDIFARQLAKVVRVHNRATPKAEWLGFDIGDDTEEDDTTGDWGMAA